MTALFFLGFLLASEIVGIVRPALTVVITILGVASSAGIDWAATISTRESQNTQSSGLRFRALLTEDGGQNVRLCRA
jgi:hypothetical protein